MKLSAPPPPPPPPSDGTPGASAPGAPDEQPKSPPAPPNVVMAPGAALSAPPAPATASAPKPAVWPEWYSGVDSALVGLVVAFAFVSASFVARNSDVWLHLAAGKKLFAGEYYPGGSDPLSYSAQGRTWVNHSWLTDAGTYLLYGGTGKLLVAVKALLVALAFGLLIGIRRPSFALWPWAAMACVGVLACAPQFTLRPLVVSMLLFAVTLFILFRMPRKDNPRRFLIAIGVTFWVWANADQWFFIGPLALALLVFGDLIQKYGFNAPDEPTETPDSEPLGRLPDVTTLAKALGVGILACTLTPHHVLIWELPFELIGAPGIESDPRIKPLLTAPTDNLYITNAGLGYNLNGLAYAVLFTGGAVIFGLGNGRVRVAHVGLWLGLAVLSLFSIYAIPFFVLAAVPLVASQLNALTARTELKTWGDPKTRLLLIGSSGGRVLSVIAVCALGVLAYPGWVHPDSSNPAYARRLAWGVETDAGLVRAAEQFKAWRESGALPAEARGFVTNTELANYLAWFAPQEKVFVNGRFRHHRRELADYLAVRRGLGLVRSDGEPNAEDAAAVLKAREVEYVALHTSASDSQQGLLAGQRLYQQYDRWSVWYLDGRTVVFGWHPGEARPSPTFAALALDPAALAFGPGAQRAPKPELTQPLTRADTPTDALVEAFIRAPRPAPAGVAAALGWLDYKNALTGRAQTRQRLAALLFYQGPPAQHSYHYFGLRLADLRGLRPPFGSPTPESLAALQIESDAMRALPLLAVRTARQAIAENPDHPDPYFALGMALNDPDLPLSESERALGRITAFRQCLMRLPKPGAYKRGQFAATGTAVALNLAQEYLGRPLPWRDASNKERVDYTGFPIQVAPFLGLLGGQPLFIERNGAVSRGQPSGPGATPYNSNTPYLLPIDLARETLQLALEYAPLDLAGEADDRLAANVKQVNDFHREVEDVVIKYKGRYDAARAGAPKLPVLVGRAIQSCMIGEALQLLSADNATLEKEFGKDRLGAEALRVALELVTGRIENAADLLEVLSDPKLAGALAQTGTAPLILSLKYQKALLAGEYALAGELWESLALSTSGVEKPPPGPNAWEPLAPSAGRLGRFDKLPPPGPDVPRPFLLGAIRAATGSQTPEKVLSGMLTPPLGFVPGHAQALQARFWLEPWEVQRLVLQQAIAQQLGAEMDFFHRRGVLFLLEGNIPAAKERFRDALRKPPPGWNLRNLQSAEADMYLKLIERAEKRLPPR